MSGGTAQVGCHCTATCYKRSNVLNNPLIVCRYVDIRIRSDFEARGSPSSHQRAFSGRSGGAGTLKV
jgi:hypothetical protein